MVEPIEHNSNIPPDLKREFISGFELGKVEGYNQAIEDAIEFIKERQRCGHISIGNYILEEILKLKKGKRKQS